MARIVEYDAPNTKLTESNQGSQAWETAGRRIGPLLNSAADDIRQEGKLAGQEIKDQRWPLSFLALAKAAPSTVGFKVVGGANRLLDSLDNQGRVGAGAANIGGLFDDAASDEGSPGYTDDREDIPPDESGWGTGTLKGDNPNAAALSQANAWYFGKAKAVEQGAKDRTFTYDNSGPSTDAYGSVSNIRQAIQNSAIGSITSEIGSVSEAIE